jgi:hypothetical protein
MGFICIISIGISRETLADIRKQFTPAKAEIPEA